MRRNFQLTDLEPECWINFTFNTLMVLSFIVFVLSLSFDTLFGIPTMYTGLTSMFLAFFCSVAPW